MKTQAGEFHRDGARLFCITRLCETETPTRPRSYAHQSVVLGWRKVGKVLFTCQGFRITIIHAKVTSRATSIGDSRLRGTVALPFLVQVTRLPERKTSRWSNVALPPSGDGSYERYHACPPFTTWPHWLYRRWEWISPWGKNHETLPVTL